jgi:hypothetical protein
MIEPIERHNQVAFTLKPRGGTTMLTWAVSGCCLHIVKGGRYSTALNLIAGVENASADLKSLAER